jgi:chemotaxis protein histidine kinase CheA
MAIIDDVAREVFADHEVMHPPHRLQKALRLGRAGPAIDPDAIARAEQALAALSVEFAAWMKNEVTVLDTARKIINETGLDETSKAALFRAAHDIKGEGSTFGYPLAARIAASLCRLIDETNAAVSLPLTLVDRHVDAIRAIVRQDVRGEDDQIASLLAERLEQVTEASLINARKKIRQDL